MKDRQFYFHIFDFHWGTEIGRMMRLRTTETKFFGICRGSFAFGLFLGKPGQHG